MDEPFHDSKLLQLLNHTTPRSNETKNKFTVFENGAVVLTKEILDCLPETDIESISKVVSDDRLTVTQSRDIHLLIGPWDNLIKAEAKLMKLTSGNQKKGNKRPADSPQSTPSQKQQKVSVNSTVHSSNIQHTCDNNASEITTNREAENSPGPLQVKVPTKTYQKATPSSGNLDTSRRSIRLSSKPRRSFAKLASGQVTDDDDVDDDDNVDIDQKPSLGIIPVGGSAVDSSYTLKSDLIDNVKADQLKQETGELTETAMPSDIIVQVSVEKGKESGTGPNIVQVVLAEPASVPHEKEELNDSQVVCAEPKIVAASDGDKVPVKRGRGRPKKIVKKVNLPEPSTIIVLKKNQENLSDLSKVIKLANEAKLKENTSQDNVVQEQIEENSEDKDDNSKDKECSGTERTEQVESDVEEFCFGEARQKNRKGTNLTVSKGEEFTPRAVNTRRRVGPKRKVPAATSTTCSECGFESKSITGMKTHMVTYHNSTEFECDICLNRFGQRHLIQKHRPHHFDADGSLRESAILIHISALEREKREENLSLELLRQVNAYREKLDEAKAKQNIKANDSEGGSKVDSTATDLTDTCSTEEATKSEIEIGASSETKDDVPGTPVKAEGSTVDSSTPAIPMHTCPICNTKVTNSKYLVKHISLVHGTSKLQTPCVKTQLKKWGNEKERLDCPHCPFVCYRVQNFTRHLLSHEKPKFYKCDQCDYTHKSKGEVGRHKRNAHDEKKFRCEHCNIMLRNEVLLRTHIKLKHMWGLSVMCETCGKVLKTRSSYLKHNEIFHGNPQRKPGRVTCELCGRTLASQKTYQAHMEKCHSDSPEGGLEEKAIAEGFVYNKDGPFSCKFCKYQNTVAREVRRHILRVHTQKDLQCDHCEARFIREAELIKHTRVYHLELEKKKCEFCNKTFLSNRYYQAHYNRIHSENKQYQCSFCKRQFYDKRTFIQHSELHKPEEERTWKYRCEQCQRRFRFKANYDNHMLEHTGYRPFPCQYCTKSFKTKNILERHLVTHSDDRPHTCTFCQKSFKLKKYLDIHLLSHTSDKFVCVYCGRIFVKEEALNKHICRYVAGKDGNPLSQETVEATQAVAGDTTQTVTMETIFPSAVDIEKFVCTNCGECFTEESEVASHDCSIPTRIVSIRDEDGEMRFFCLNCSSEFQTEEESADHQCQVVTVEPVAPETVARYSSMETLLQDSETTTIVVESLGESVSVQNMVEVVPAPENQPIMDGDLEIKPGMVGDLGNSATGEENLETVSQNALVEFLPSGEGISDSQQIGGEIKTEGGGVYQEGVELYQEGEEPYPAQVYMCGLCQQIYQSEEEIHLHVQEHVGQTETISETLQDGSIGIGIDNGLGMEGNSLVLDTGSLVVNESGMVIDGLAMEESIETTILH